MGKPPGVPKTLNQAQAIKLLRHYGWTKESGGNHGVKMTKPGKRPVILPDNKRRDYPPGLRSAILQQAGITQ